MNKILNYICEKDGVRLDVVLKEKLSDMSRSFIQKLIDTGSVSVGGKERKANYKPSIGELIVVHFPEPKEIEVKPEQISLDILYEDKDIIVVNKPRGMVVHPAAGVFEGTLVNALMAHCDDLSGIGGVIRPGIVHRLDKDTSGVMVVAKNDFAHMELAEQIKNKIARRVYRAIVFGNIKEDAGTINGNIGRDPFNRKRMAIVATGGKSATTKFKVIERFGNYTLVECRLLTGRTHQIRVHMTSIGHPLVGDPKYGRGKSPFKIQGQALHSMSLSLYQPQTKEELIFYAPMPSDMEKILMSLKK